MKGAIKETRLQGGFISNIHIVPKKEGGWRPIIDLRILNSFVISQHFKMEGLQMLKEVLEQNHWMGKVDLKDAYLTVPIHHSHTGYLKFLWKGKAYKFLCLPFRLASAPRTFTKILKPVANFLRSHGVKMLVIIDDILVTADTKESLRQQLRPVSSTLTALGFALSTKKCILEPTQQIEFLGMMIDSKEMKIYLPKVKIEKIKKECRYASTTSSQSDRCHI